MKCEVCNKTVAGDGVALHRVNPKGVIGIWRCPSCLTVKQRAALDPEVVKIVGIIMDGNDQKLPKTSASMRINDLILEEWDKDRTIQAMKFEKPDGTIELGFSGCCCPPGQKRRGLHTQACTSWWRIIRDFRPTPWTRDRHSTQTRTLAGAANTCVEFLEAMQP